MPELEEALDGNHRDSILYHKKKQKNDPQNQTSSNHTYNVNPPPHLTHIVHKRRNKRPNTKRINARTAKQGTQYPLGPSEYPKTPGTQETKACFFCTIPPIERPTARHITIAREF